MASEKRVLSAGEARALAAVNCAESAAWQVKRTIAVVLVRLNGDYHGAFISAYPPNERSPSLSGENVRVGVDPISSGAIKAAIINGQPVPEDLVIQRADDEDGEER